MSLTCNVNTHVSAKYPKTYFDVFGTLFKELFQNVEVEDEQLWSIDE